MRGRTSKFVTCTHYFVRYALYVREVLTGLIVLLVLCAGMMSRVERIEIGDAIYFAFITGLSITPSAGPRQAVNRP